MARRCTLGFEEGGTTPFAALGLSTVTTAGNGENSMVTSATTAPHSGTYCYRSRTTAPLAGSIASITKSTGVSKTSGTAWLVGMFKWHTHSAGTLSFADIQNSSATSVYRVGITAGHLLVLTNLITTTAQTGANALAADTWYRLELTMLVDNAAGALTLNAYVGDSLTVYDTLTITGEDTLTTNIQRLRMGLTVASSNDWDFYFDDWRWVDDAAGAGDTAVPGPGKLALMPVASDVAVTWTPTSGGTNALMVDDVPGDPDDATTTTTDSGTTNVDRLALTALPAEVPSDAVISLVSVEARLSAGAASQTMITRVWDEVGTSTDSAVLSLGNGTWSNFFLAALTAGKTKANLNAFNVGYKGNTGVSAKSVTAIWMNVEWIEASGSKPMFRPVS